MIHKFAGLDPWHRPGGALALALLLAMGASAERCSAQAPEPANAELASAQAPQSANAELVVEVGGVEDDRGQVLVALFDSEDAFTDRPTMAQVLPARGGTLRWTVMVAPGEWAVAVIHDRDGNGELNKNLVGMPREPYGFSNGARGRFSAPGFSDARVMVSGPTVVAVHVR